MDAHTTTVTTSTGTISGEALETPEGSSSSTKDEKKDENAADEKNEDRMSLNEFLIHFLRNHRDDNFLSVKHGNYTVTSEEAIGEIVDWTMQYLQYMSCPAHLEAGLTRAVLDEARANYLNHNTTSMSPTGGTTGESDGTKNEKFASSEDLHPAHPSLTSTATSTKGSQVFQSMKLLQNVTSTVHQVCRRLKMEEYKSNASMLNQKIKPGRLTPNSVHAVKNGRRKMEDRHVVIHDLNMIYSDTNNDVSGAECEPPMSFYGVYDGHAGKDAAAFAASHLHGHILNSPYFPSDPVLAIKDAFHKTDNIFLEKGQKEPLKSGTTAVCSLIRGQTLYSAWLGDSQSVLVRNGYPVKVVEPHKPNRPDEKQRIEELGGTVIHWGTWRVNGQLAVSRAIGDGDYKPYVSSDPDVTTVEMNGSEDFIIIACDGLWDTVTPMSATTCVYKQLLQTEKDNFDSISQQLVILAKDNGSTDNITVVVVFLKPIEEILHKIRTEYHHLENENIHNYDTIDCGGSFTYTNVPGLQLYEGVTSTSKFVTDFNMNGGSTENLTNGDDIHHLDETPSPGIKSNNNPFSTMIDLGLTEKQFQGDSSSDCGNNPFSSPGAQAFGGGFGDVVNPFTDMSGNDVNTMTGFEEGRMGTHSSSEGGDDSLDGSCNDVMISQDQALLNLSGEEFNNAIPNKFEESQSPSMFDRPPVEPNTPSLNSNDEEALMNNESFGGNPTHDWMTSPNSNASVDENSAQNMSAMAATGIGANPMTNPFLPHTKCGDSGFISPAGNSQHQSASSSSEDSAENREERESVERAGSVGSDRQSDAASVASVHELIKRESVSSDKDEDRVDMDTKDMVDSDDEEAKEHQEVTKLLSGGGVMDPQLGDLMASVNRGTPTPPVEENESTLEEILAAARNQPDEPGLVDDVDSDETSSDADEEPLEHNSASRKSSHLSQQFEAPENLEQSAGVVECEDVDSSSDSSSDNDDDGFTFVKKDQDDIINNFPRSNSPLVIDTIVNESEDKQEAELEINENFEKPEVILKSALVNPNCEEDISFQEKDQINEQEGLENETDVHVEQVIPSENVSELEDKEQHNDEPVASQVEAKEVSTDYNIDHSENIVEAEKEANFEAVEGIEGQIKENPLFDNEEISDIKEVIEPEINTEQNYTQSASPLQVSPAVNTLNALEDYMNHDLADAESSSAPSSLESQSGPASVIIESQEVPIPDQASFIIKTTESQPIDLPSPQEAVVEVLPEEHFRERSQSPILEENEDMSDSESKSPIPTSHINGNAYESNEVVDSEMINKDLHALKECTPEPNEAEPCAVSSDNEKDACSDIENTLNDKETIVENTNLDVHKTLEEHKFVDNSSTEHIENDTEEQCVNNDDLEVQKDLVIADQIDSNQELPIDNDKEVQEIKEEITLPSSNEPVEDQATVEDVAAHLISSLPSNDGAPTNQISDVIKTEDKEDKIEESYEKPEAEGASSLQLEAEIASNKSPTPEPQIDEGKPEMNNEDSKEAIHVKEGLSLNCGETPIEEPYKVDEPATAEVTEGNIGFYTETEPRMESKDSELKCDDAEQIEEKKEEIKEDVIEEIKEEVTEEVKEYVKEEVKEEVKEDVMEVKQELIEEVTEEIKDELKEDITQEMEIKEEHVDTEKCDNEKIVSEAPLDIAKESPINEVEEKLSEKEAIQNDTKDESVFLSTPEVSLTPATPIPEVQYETVESPVEVEVKVPIDLVSSEPEKIIETPAVVQPTEEKDTKKSGDKKLEGKSAASPSPKRGVKPSPSKPAATTRVGNKAAPSPKPTTRPTATKPSSTPASRVASSTASKQSTTGSTLANKRPTSGTAASRSTPVSSTTPARSGVASKPAARTSTPRTTTSTPARQPPSARTPAAKPRPTGVSSTTTAAKPSSSLTSRPIASKSTVSKSKVDEPKKTATSSVSARSTLTRTASPASGSRSRTPVSPKTTVPKTTRSTTTSRSTVTSTTSTTRASTKPATASTTGATAASRKPPTPRTAPIRSTTTPASSRTTVPRTTGASSRTATQSSTSPAKSKPLGSDIMRRPLVPSGPRPTDLTKKRIPSAKDKQQSNSTKPVTSKSKTAGAASTPEENGVEKTSNDSQIKINGGSTPDESNQLINGANGEDNNVGSGQNPSTPVNSSGAASPIGELGQTSLANGVL